MCRRLAPSPATRCRNNDPEGFQVGTEGKRGNGDSEITTLKRVHARAPGACRSRPFTQFPLVVPFLCSRRFLLLDLRGLPFPTLPDRFFTEFILGFPCHSPRFPAP